MTRLHRLESVLPSVAGKVNQSGFDLSGMDLWSAGTLYKNISFVLLPSSDSTAVWHFEAAWVRFDNLKNSPWLNVRFGRFELDNLISEKRFLFLSEQRWHLSDLSLQYSRAARTTSGTETTRSASNWPATASIAIPDIPLRCLSSNEGGVGFTNDVVPVRPPASRTYDVNLAFSQAFDAKSLGFERIGAFAYIGQRPTYYQTTRWRAIPRGWSGLGNKGFLSCGFCGRPLHSQSRITATIHVRA